MQSWDFDVQSRHEFRVLKAYVPTTYVQAMYAGVIQADLK